MSELFNRKVQVSIGKRGGQGTLIEDLRIVFKIERTLDKAPNNAQIEIYNLSEKTRALFEMKNAAIRLTAGYEGTLKDIFVGDVASVVTKTSGADLITSVEAGDGEEAFQNRQADLSFAPGAKFGQVLDQLVGSFGLAKGEIQGVDTNDQYLNGLALSGKVSDHFDTVLGKQRGLNWSIQDGQVQILPKLKGSTRPAILLSPSTGLIGSPFKKTIVSMDLAKKKDGKDAESGVELKSLLNPEIIPGRLVKVEARFVNGSFKVEKLTHAGDTRGGTYYTDMEAVGL